MLSSYWQCPKVLYLKITSTERARVSSLPTNYFPEGNGKGGEREKQVLTVYCRSSKKKWTKLKELQLFVCI